MTNQELLTAMQAQGNLIIAHVGEPKKTREQRMIEFAEIVLDLMQNEPEWNANILDAIAEHSADLELSTLNQFHEFVKTSN